MRVVSRRSFTSAIALLGAAAVVPGVARSAFAAAPPDAIELELMALQASNGPAPSIDPKVDEGMTAPNLPSAKLKTPPLSAYNTYVMKNKTIITLKKGVIQTVPFQNGRSLQITLTNVTIDKQGVKHGTVLAMISPQPGTDAGAGYTRLIEFTASPAQSVFVGGIASPTTGSLVAAFIVLS